MASSSVASTLPSASATGTGTGAAAASPSAASSEPSVEDLESEIPEAEFAKLRVAFKMPSRIRPYLFVGTRVRRPDSVGSEHRPSHPLCVDGWVGQAAAVDASVVRACGITHILNVREQCSRVELHPPDTKSSAKSAAVDSDSDSTETSDEEDANRRKSKPSASLGFVRSDGIRYLHVPISDFGDTELEAESILSRCHAFISHAKQQFELYAAHHSANGASSASATPSSNSTASALVPAAPGCVLIHCSMGVNRSPTVVLSWLIACEKMTLKAAYSLVKELRPRMAPHEKYMEQVLPIRGVLRVPGLTAGAVFSLHAASDI
jgi:hypothetical protein